MLSRAFVVVVVVAWFNCIFYVGLIFLCWTYFSILFNVLEESGIMRKIMREKGYFEENYEENNEKKNVVPHNIRKIMRKMHRGDRKCCAHEVSAK